MLKMIAHTLSITYLWKHLIFLLCYCALLDHKTKANFKPFALFFVFSMYLDAWMSRILCECVCVCVCSMNMCDSLLFVNRAWARARARFGKKSKYLTDFNICVKTGMTERRTLNGNTHSHMRSFKSHCDYRLFARFCRAFVIYLYIYLHFYVCVTHLKCSSIK